MEGLQGLIAEGRRIMQTLLGLCGLIACDILVALDVGADGEIDCCLISISHADQAIAARGLSTNGLNGHASLKANLPLQTLMFRGYTMKYGFQFIAADEHILMG